MSFPVLEKNEEHLLAAEAISGQKEAISTLWELHRRWVGAVLLSHMPRGEDLEDLLQEVAMTLVGKIATVRNPAHVRAWLRTVAINTARAAARTQATRPRLKLVGANCEGEGDPAIDQTMIRDEESHRMLDLVAQLSEEYREPLMLRALHGMRTKQISRILEIPEGTIDTRISRARRMLRELGRGEEES